MTGIDVYYAIETIRPRFMIPIHYVDEVKRTFLYTYNDLVEDLGCTIIDLEYYQSHTFPDN